MARFFKAPDDVVEMVGAMVELYHDDLAEATIGVLMRDEAPVSGGFVTLGKARKVPPEQRALIDFDFVIWFAADEWERLTERQRRALADHELCHCSKFRGKTSIRKHDFEEFNCIIERHGFWRPFGELTQIVVQRRLGIDVQKGRVATVDLHKAQANILEQIGDMLTREEA